MNINFDYQLRYTLIVFFVYGLIYLLHFTCENIIEEKFRNFLEGTESNKEKKRFIIKIYLSVFLVSTIILFVLISVLKWDNNFSFLAWVVFVLTSLNATAVGIRKANFKLVFKKATEVRINNNSKLEGLTNVQKYEIINLILNSKEDETKIFKNHKKDRANLESKP